MIPAGRIGNKLPIEIVSERCHSPELNVVVLTRYADPRSGERIYRLESIKRDEPNAELFKVPADFALKSVPTRESDRKKVAAIEQSARGGHASLRALARKDPCQITAGIALLAGGY